MCISIRNKTSSLTAGLSHLQAKIREAKTELSQDDNEFGWRISWKKLHVVCERASQLKTAISNASEDQTKLTDNETHLLNQINCALFEAAEIKGKLDINIKKTLEIQKSVDIRIETKTLPKSKVIELESETTVSFEAKKTQEKTESEEKTETIVKMVPVEEENELLKNELKKLRTSYQQLQENYDDLAEKSDLECYQYESDIQNLNQSVNQWKNAYEDSKQGKETLLRNLRSFQSALNEAKNENEALRNEYTTHVEQNAGKSDTIDPVKQLICNIAETKLEENRPELHEEINESDQVAEIFDQNEVIQEKIYQNGNLKGELSAEISEEAIVFESKAVPKQKQNHKDPPKVKKKVIPNPIFVELSPQMKTRSRKVKNNSASGDNRLVSNT